jgi:hypothetical protein
MNAITSIYIPHVENYIGAEYIADVLSKNGIATVNKIVFEPYKGRTDAYKKAYVDIKNWHDTESAFWFISRLKNEFVEARLVHSYDDWWTVEINKYPHKIESKENVREITIFKYVDIVDEHQTIDSNDISCCEEDCLSDDLQAMFYGYKNSDEMDSADDFDSIMNEVEAEREKWISEQYIYDALNM